MRPNDTSAPGFYSSSPSQVYWYRTSVLHLAIDTKLTVPYFAAGDTSVGFTPQKANSVRVTFSRRPNASKCSKSLHEALMPRMRS